MKHISLIFLLCISNLSFSQNVDFEGTWTTLADFYNCKKTDDGYLFYGGNHHEGGARFFIQYDKVKKKYIISGHKEYGDWPSVGEIGYSIELIEINRKKYLLIRDSMSLIQEVLKDMKESKYTSYFEIYKINIELSGEYVTEDSDQKVTFSESKPFVKGLCESGNYSFGKEYETPVNVLVFEKCTLLYERNIDTLIFFNSHFDYDYDEFIKKEEYRRMVRTKNSGRKYNSNFDGAYPLASVELLTNKELRSFSKNELKIMRNEIFARYGYRFKTHGIKSYFESQLWYNGQFDNVNDMLTEIEKINIRRIKTLEQK